MFLKKGDRQHSTFLVITSEEQCTELKFIIAECSQEVLPCRFKKAGKGLFNTHSQYTAIKVELVKVDRVLGKVKWSNTRDKICQILFVVLLDRTNRY